MAESSFVSTSSKRLQGKVALITGGASGIGESIVKLFARHGAKVIIADLQSELGKRLADQVQTETRETVSYVHCDVTKESDVENAVNTAVSLHGKLDIMFNNAGIFGNFDPSLHHLDHENFKKVMDINVYGGLLGAKHAARVMIPEKKGCILFSASAASVLHGNMPYAYAASKHAIVGVAKNLAVDLGQYGIRVNCISPAVVITPMSKALFADENVVKDYASMTASLKGVEVSVDDMAEAALYLASEESKFVSGLNLVVDGAANLRNAGSAAASF